MDISEVIKNIRIDSVLSQESFAKKLGVSQITITRWETGKAVPNYATMQRLLTYCDLKGIDAEELKKVWRSINE